MKEEKNKGILKIFCLTLRSYSLSKLPVCHTTASAIVITWYMIYLILHYFITGSLFLFTTLFQFLLPPPLPLLIISLFFFYLKFYIYLFFGCCCCNKIPHASERNGVVRVRTSMKTEGFKRKGWIVFKVVKSNCWEYRQDILMRRWRKTSKVTFRFKEWTISVIQPEWSNKFGGFVKVQLEVTEGDVAEWKYIVETRKCETNCRNKSELEL